MARCYSKGERASRPFLDLQYQHASSNRGKVNINMLYASYTLHCTVLHKTTLLQLFFINVVNFLMSSKTPNKTIPSNDGTLPSEADLAALSALIDADFSDEHADENLAELLKQLDRADQVALNMESRLDVILEQLNGMVGHLETAHAHRHAEDASASGDSLKGKADNSSSPQVNNPEAPT